MAATSTDLRDTLAQLRSFGLALPEAWEDFPWGETALKVRKKVFVFLHRGSDPDENGAEQTVLAFTVKLPHSLHDALERPDATPTGYGLGRHGWVSLRIVEASPSPPSLQTLQDWMLESYRAVAPKTLVRRLDAQH